MMVGMTENAKNRPEMSRNNQGMKVSTNKNNAETA